MEEKPKVIERIDAKDLLHPVRMDCLIKTIEALLAANDDSPSAGFVLILAGQNEDEKSVNLGVITNQKEEVRNTLIEHTLETLIGNKIPSTRIPE